MDINTLKQQHQIIENIEHFNINDFEKLNNFISKHNGKTTQYYVENIQFHQFTCESFEYLIQQINTFRNTYFDIGPFVNKNGLWYANKSTENLENIIKSLEDVVLKQQKEIEKLKQQVEEK